MSNDQWFYTDAQQQQLGPITFAQVQQLAASGHILAETLVWCEGMAEWAAAGQVQGIFQQAAPVALATAPAAAPASVNPYAVGSADQAGAPATGAYPAPFVKKTSFGLYLGSSIAGLILIIIGFASLAASAPTPPDYSEENSRISNAETKEQLAEAQDAKDLKQAEFSEEISAPIGASLGLGTVALLAGCVAILFAGIYSYIILYRSWHILQPGGARTTPGAAVGFLFIPFFSLYWIFNVYPGWATDWNRIRSSYPDLQAAPAASGGMFVAAVILLIFFFPIGIILFLICTKQMCDTINFFASRQSLGAGLGGAGTTATMPNLI